MPVTKFPDPRQTGPEGIVAFGGDLHPDTLLLAYRQGIFPWPIEELPLAWFCPPERAILDFNEIHIPRSLERARKKAHYRFSVDEAFAEVIKRCRSARRPGQRGTWITRELMDAYIEFHRLGYAHSVEVWEGETLVGGIYGVAVDGCFAGESMFHARPNASKLALLHLVDLLRERGLDWMDIQMLTPHLEALGARVVTRDQFLSRLAETQKRQLTLF